MAQAATGVIVESPPPDSNDAPPVADTAEREDAEVVADAEPLVPEERIVIDVLPTDFGEILSRHTQAQAGKLLQDYVGKWVRWSGRLGDVIDSGFGHMDVAFEVSDYGWPMPYMMFRDKKWIDRLSVMQKGDCLTVMGQITHISPIHIILDNCEIAG